MMLLVLGYKMNYLTFPGVSIVSPHLDLYTGPHFGESEYISYVRFIYGVSMIYQQHGKGLEL